MCFCTKRVSCKLPVESSQSYYELASRGTQGETSLAIYFGRASLQLLRPSRSAAKRIVHQGAKKRHCVTAFKRCLLLLDMCNALS